MGKKLKQDIWGYKTAGDYLITLFIKKGTLTNLARKDVKCGKTAKFRCEKAQVISIQSWKTGKYCKSVYSDWDKSFCYKVGQKVKDAFNEDINKICTNGIHFFLSPLGAYAYWRKVEIDDVNGFIGYSWEHTKNKKKHTKNKKKLVKKMTKLNLSFPEYIKRSQILRK